MYRKLLVLRHPTKTLQSIKLTRLEYKETRTQSKQIWDKLFLNTSPHMYYCKPNRVTKANCPTILTNKGVSLNF